MIHVKFSSADISVSIQRMQNAGVILHRFYRIDDCSAVFCVRKQDFAIVKSVCQRYGEPFEICRRNDTGWQVKHLLNRPILLIGTAILLILSAFLQNRILFIQVEGNLRVPTNQIIEEASRCGIYFGASRRTIQNEDIKNTLLDSIPQLQWIGVRTDGCVATITVTERKEKENTGNFEGITHIVSSRDGVIDSITVTRGHALRKPGDAVKKGEILISGIVDTGLSTKLTGAQGEVNAFTQHHFSILAPCVQYDRSDLLDVQQKIFLIIGKKRINFSNSSGILDGSCAKIYKQKYISFPGGFILPICLVTETWQIYRTQTVNTDIAQDAVLSYADTYLKGQMIGGRVLTQSYVWTQLDGGFQMDIYFGCIEMIGKILNEEIIKEYENN